MKLIEKKIRLATVALVVLGVLCGSPAVRSADDETTGTLSARVILVTADLSLKPVPKKRFRIVPHGADAASKELSTSFEGGIDIALAPGRYRLRTESAVEFEGKRFSWDVEFEIEPGSTTAVELSNDNAAIESGTVTTEGALYERFKDGVFKVISDDGHGSGFLVSEDGLVLTNHHVVVDAFYLAVELDDRHKFGVEVLAEDPNQDLAVLRIHPETVRGRPVMKLADDAPGHPPVAVGEKVLAIGSPLTTETILTSGLVSKVEEEAIYSDVSINPGNSGGPLFSMRGEVIGISSFGLFGEAGSGVSGIARIYLAAPLLEEARARAAETEPPSARPLPMEPAWRFPPETVKTMALAEARELDDYHIEAGKLDVHFVTPVLLASMVIEEEREALEGRKKRKRKKRQGREDEETFEPGEAFYEWQKDSDNFRAVVTVQAYPEVNTKSAMAGTLIGRGKLRFKTDFERMELTRDDEIVEPIHPGRIKEVVSEKGFKDVGYWGYYEYPPEAFESGAKVTLTIWEEDEPDPKVLVLSPELLEMIRIDLQPYFDNPAGTD
jgi:S1-C subfamily serine protease